MDISVSNTGIDAIVADLLVVCATPKEVAGRSARGERKRNDPLTFRDLDERYHGELSAGLRRVEFSGAPHTAHLFGWTRESAVRSILVVGAGPKDKSVRAAHDAMRNLGSVIVRNARAAKARRVFLSAAQLDLSEDLFSSLLEGIYLAQYQFEGFRSDSKEKSWSLESLHLLAPKKISEKTLVRAKALSEGTMLARDLINLPPNIATPAHLVKIAKEIASKGRLKISILDRAELKKRGANSLLAVAQGSAQPPYLIKLSYLPDKRSSKTRVISIVGKGITFDSGGLCIKSDSGMESMKIDMSGAAAVLGVMKAVAALRPSVEVRGYIPTCENMLGDSAMRPGDVVRAMNGKSIEILNTDAEGRLILADALSMASHDKCDVMIDVATLTGACMVALGLLYAGMFSNNDRLADGILSAGARAGEHYWRMPLVEEYRDLLKSKVADMKNIGGRYGGAITAALFLREFVSDCAWAHLDICGPADTDKDVDHFRPGGTGFGVRTLLNYVLSQ